MITLTIPIVPVAWGRARTKGGHHFKPARTRAYEDRIALAVRQGYTGPQIEGPVRLEAVFILPRPKAAPKRLPGRLVAAKKPDLDNLLKAVKDGITASGLWRDDAQVVAITCSKWVAAASEMPSITLTIERLEE